MKDSEKVELERLARIANQDPHGDSFWDEVDKILEENSKEDDEPLVKPRREKE